VISDLCKEILCRVTYRSLILIDVCRISIHCNLKSLKVTFGLLMNIILRGTPGPHILDKCFSISIDCIMK
jgi:hypothetical protein